MPTAPRTHRPAHQPSREVVRRQNDQRRQSSKDRGYSNTGRWNRFSESIKLERIFCELCLTLGYEVDTTGPNAGVTDHIIPVDGKDDPLFFDPCAVWRLCTACDRWKSINFDGSYGAKKIVTADRSMDGVRKRRAEIVVRFKAVDGSRGVVGKPVPGAM